MSRLRAGHWLVWSVAVWCACGTAWSDDAPPAGGRFALLVGVKQYTSMELRELKYSEADVTSLSETLLAGGYEPANVMLMTQAAGGTEARKTPTAANIRKELKLLLEGRKPEDVVVVAFAGHGVQFAGSEENFFCPMDAELTKQESLISLTEIFGELEKCPAAFKLLLVDACRNDPQVELSRSSGDVELESVTRPPPDVPSEGIAAFYSCSATQKAYEDDELQHGVFFHFVIEALKGRASRDQKPEVHLGDLQFYVNNGVEPFVRQKLRQKQLPQLICRTQGATPPLVVWPKPPEAPAGGEAPAYAGFDPRLLAGAVGPTDKVDLPGYATKGHKIRRIIAVRQLTNHRPADAAPYSPELVAISADGSTIAAYAPATGIYTMNFDGSNYKLIVPNDPSRTVPIAGRLHLSPDGSRIYWQGNGGPIYRVNSDGEDLRELVKSGAEYTPLKLRWWGNRIYYGTRGGLYSIDTEGVGDYRELLTQADLFNVFNVQGLLLNEFDVDETGERLVCALYDPDLKKKQVFAMPVGGDPVAGLRILVETEFEPTKILISPDGSRVLFEQYGGKKYVVNWDGTGMRELNLPPSSWSIPEFTPDGRWISYSVDYYGTVIVNIDTGEIVDTIQTGNWGDNELALFQWPSAVALSKDLRRFVYVMNHGGGSMPRQIVAGEINPSQLEGLPLLADIEFPKTLSAKPELPNHFGALRVKVTSERPVERVQFNLTPGTHFHVGNNRWEHSVSQALYGGTRLNDAGMDGDAAAGDGIWSTANFGKPNLFYADPGKHLLRIVAHEKTTFRGFEKASAVIVDLEGVEVKE
jgi:hypothetical protein